MHFVVCSHDVIKTTAACPAFLISFHAREKPFRYGTENLEWLIVLPLLRHNRLLRRHSAFSAERFDAKIMKSNRRTLALYRGCPQHLNKRFVGIAKLNYSGFRDDIRIEQLIQPVSTFLVPIFFVLMGIQVRLETFANLGILGIAAGLTIAAIMGKQICGLGIFEKGLDRLTVGVGMIPRGEVGLIFANIGKNLRVIDDATFSAVVIMVIVTTLITPPLLKYAMARAERASNRVLQS
jgi:hypothetical protein